MKQTIPLILLLSVFFSACANSQQVTKSANVPTNTSTPNLSTQTPDGLAIRSTERVGTVVALQTAGITPLAVESTITPVPASTSTGNYNGEVTWHPKQVLLQISEDPNDGNSWYSKWPSLRLYWDGTLIRPDGDGVDIAQMSRVEMCKLFNSIEQAGWFNVDPFSYNPPFSGAWGESISVSLWHERVGGGQQFISALEGAGVRDSDFCGECGIPSPHNFITAAEANTYYLIYDNLPTDFKLKTDFQGPGTVPNDYQITCKESDGAYPFPPVESNAKFVLLSNSGRRAVSILNQNSADVTTALYKIDGSVQYFSYDPKSFDAVSLTVIPRLWSKDNQYVYLSLYPDNANIQPFHEAMALQQIDTNTGQTRYFFQGQANDFYSYELSDTGSRLAYIKQDQNPFELVILDLSTGKETKIPVESPDISANEFKMAGGLRFTYDLNKLFFSAISEQGSLKTTFFMVDLLNPVKLYIIHQMSGAYKISYIAYDTDYPKWMKICSIDDGLTDYCFSDTVNFH